MNGYYAQLVEQAADGLVIHDGQRIVAANAAALRLAGASRHDQLVGQPVSMFFERPYLKSVARALCDRMGTDAQRAFGRERLHALDGSVREVMVSAQLFVHAGHLRVHVVLHDLHDQLEAERTALELEEERRQAERSADWRAVMGGIAHQLNNRLQVVIGFSEGLLASTLSDDQRADVAEVTRAAQSSALITRRMLQMVGDAPFMPRRLFLNTSVYAILQDWEVAANSSSGRVGYASGAVPAVNMDASHLQQMMECLLDNARCATRTSGQIQVVVRATTLPEPQLAADGRIMPPGEYVTITVRDSGEGIGADVQRHMLEPFFTTHLADGAPGLGLPALLGMARQNGAFLTFTSAPNHGASFVVWVASLPLASDRGATSVGATGARARTILVVEHHEPTRAALVRSFARVGYRVLATASGEEALELLRHVAVPALIVVGTSAQSGDTAFPHALQQQWPSVPILLLSGESDARRTEWHGVAGTWSVLPSPFSEYELVNAAQQLVRATRSDVQ
ncbi:ATP-binding protein [Gemmatimonas sp.]|uniref:ATP-binding response regulator n=1 Tax=Gemmatimonas sp. TaxID=1962908 RepID=UPI003DA6B169